MAEDQNLLLSKIDAFTRKYYQNQIIRGALYFIAIGLAAYLFSVTLEYFGRFSSGVRGVLFYGLVMTYVGLFIRFIAIPGSKLFKLGKVISYEEAAQIIGQHFPEVSDKLLNTLQLSQRAKINAKDSALLMASIDQKTGELQPVPFASAIDFGENKKYAKYVVPPVLLALLMLVISPSILKDGTERIVSYEKTYEAEAPFQFIIGNEELSVPMNSDFELDVRVEGDYVPTELVVWVGEKRFRMKSSDEPGSFSHAFKNVREPIPFKLSADGFDSQGYIVEVVPVPSISHFQVALQYPSYLGRKDENLANTGNLKVPVGTFVSWKFSTKNADAVHVSFKDTSAVLDGQGKQSFVYGKQVFSSEKYRVGASNNVVGNMDTIAYYLDVIPDQFPRIDVVSSIDSNQVSQHYFGGTIADDYGLRALVFHYTVKKSSGEEIKHKTNLKIGGQTAQEFFHSFDFKTLNLEPGDQVDYYFEVWDNDGVNGSKSSRSGVKQFKAPSLRELEEARKESAENIKDKLEKSIEEAAELQKEIQELNKDLLDKPEMGWQEKKRIENVLNRQKELEQNIEQLQQEQKQSLQEQSEYNKEESQRIMEKQELLEKMFEELMSEEMKEMYKKLEEMMKELNQEELRQELEQMEMSSEELEKELDRTLEIFKQMEFEQAFDDAVEKLEELAEKQEELSEQSESGEKTEEELKEEQEKLNEEFEQVKEDLKALEELNKDLERPNDMPDNKKQQEEIEQDMQDASEQLEKKKKKKASDSQQSASDKMEEMANQMKMAMQGQQAQQQKEDMEALRALLENIIQLSFDQEEIMDNIGGLDKGDPRYVEMGQRQKKLEDDSQMVEDSLFALSKRVPQLESLVNEEIGSINRNHAKALEDIGERRTANAVSRQQYVMTSYNNLALLLDEALQQMQMQMANEMPGKGNCENPGGQGQNPSEGKMGKMQEQMGKKLEELQKQMEKGKSEGGQKPGMGKQGMSKELAKMAAEQAAIRQEIEKMAQKLNERGKGEGKGLEDLAKQMEEQERDIVNQEIDRQTLKRQEEIMTRLLKSEKAEREREYDDKRESNRPKDYEPSNPEKYLEYNKRKAREVELLRTVPPDLSPYYKERVNDYFLNFEN